MTAGQCIDVRKLTKRFQDVTAVDELSFSVQPGRVTGFLGPNGSGKTTTMRMVLGLVTPSSGTATIGGVRYRELARPARVVGAVLDHSETHPASTARDHLRIYAAMAGLRPDRVDTVLEQSGLTAHADRRTGGFSTGMRQRLGLATALLGDPGVLMLDEPSNGLDPQGLAWLRDLLAGLAAEGRTVLISSHVLSELEQIADDVVVIRAGRLVATAAVSELPTATTASVLVRSPEASALLDLLQAIAGVTVTSGTDGSLTVSGFGAPEIADLAAVNGLRIHELTPQSPSLEQAFLTLTTTA